MYEKDITNAKNYYDLYQASQEKIRQENLVSNSLLYSIIREVKDSETQFLADITEYYYREDTTKASWKKPFFEKMNEHFFKEVSWEFENIISGGYEGYYYAVDFEMNGIKYTLEIPNPRKITIDNIVAANYGMFSLRKNPSGAVWKHICSSYNVKDIADAIKKELEV